MKKAPLTICFFAGLALFLSPLSAQTIVRAPQEDVDRIYDEAAALQAKLKIDDAEVTQKIQQIESAKEDILWLNKHPEEGNTTLTARTFALTQGYKNLDANQYVSNSIYGFIIADVEPYNLITNSWRLHLSSEFLGFSNLFEETFDISYNDFTGRTYNVYGDLSKKQEEEYQYNVQYYDSLFEQGAPLLYAKLTYKIQTWRRASEYRFLPIKCEIYRTDRNKLLKTVYMLDMLPQTFTFYPQYDVRTAQELYDDYQRVDKILAEEEELRNNPSSYEKVINRGFKQHKRNTAYLTSDTVFANSDFANFDFRNIKLNAVDFNVTLGINDYLYAGGLFGYCYNGNGKNDSYGGGIIGGANYTFVNHIRPFAEAGLIMHTNWDFNISLGLGSDFTIGRILAVIDYSYAWTFQFGNLINKTAPLSQSIYGRHKFSFGIGFTW